MGLMLVASCNRPDDSAEVYPPVFYEVLGEKADGTGGSFPGVVFPGNQARLAFKVPGTISRLNVKMGDTLRRGEAVASLDTTDYAVNYSKALSAYKGAEAGYVTAKSAFVRTERLYINGNVSLTEYEKVKLQMESALSALRAAEQQLQGAENQLGYTVLRAPFDGFVSSFMFDEGEMAGAGHPVAIYSSLSGTEIRSALPEEFAKVVSEGDSVAFYVNSLPDKEYRGVVSELSPGSGATSSYPVVVAVDGASGGLLPGMSVTVDFRIDDKVSEGGALIVPAYALAHDGDEDYIYVAVFEKNMSDSEIPEPAEGASVKGGVVSGGVYTVRRRVVVTGRLTSKGYEVLDGASAGDIVITAGLSNLFDGMRVRLIEKN